MTIGEVLLPPPVALGLPARFDDWRPGQAQALLTGIDAPSRVTGLVLPTGSGKSLINIGVAKLRGRETRTAILTGTKALQRQYLRDFEEVGLVEISGMNAYPCRYPEWMAAGFHRTCDEGPCLTGGGCYLRDGGCLYYDALRRAQQASLVVTNYAYWFASYTYGRGLGGFDLLVLDEAHNAAEELAGFLSTVLVRAEWRKHLGIQLPEHTTVQPWAEWTGAQCPKIDQWLESDRPSEPEVQRWLTQQRRKLGILSSMREGEWILAHTHDKTRFDPLWPGRWAEEYLFRGIKRIILTSATLRPATVPYLGLDPDDMTWLESESSFPLDRRPVYLLKTDPPVRVDHKWNTGTEALWLSRIDNIIGQRLDRKGIIHTVSYLRRNLILARSEYRDLMITHDTGTTRQAVEKFKTSRAPAILVSPSLVTGYDFPGPECEYQIIGKVPFPDSRDPIIAARTQQDRDYPAYLAMQALVQSTGRGMRSADDACETFVIDDHARWFLRANRALAPIWFLDAVRHVRTLPPPPPALIAI